MSSVLRTQIGHFLLVSQVLVSVCSSGKCKVQMSHRSHYQGSAKCCDLNSFPSSSMLDLQSVVISIPFPVLREAPKVQHIDGEWRLWHLSHMECLYRKNILHSFKLSYKLSCPLMDLANFSFTFQIPFK